MGFKKVNIGGIEDLIEFIKGESVVGIYEGPEQYIAKNTDVYTLGKLILPNGVKQRFFLGGQLAFLLSKVEIGANVRITYLGLTEKVVKTKKGGEKQIHQYKVEVDDGS